MRSSSGNSLRRIHILEFDPELINELECSDVNTICIATVAVYPDVKNMEFSSGYIQESVGYFSSNTYQYYIPLNSPYQMNEGYSLVYFTHQLVEGENL